MVDVIYWAGFSSDPQSRVAKIGAMIESESVDAGYISFRALGHLVTSVVHC